jgi:glutaredoxin
MKIIYAFFNQLSAIWRQIDTLGPQLSPATCQWCKDQKATLELRRTYDFLIHLRDEFEPLCAQLLAHHPCVSLMDALAEVHNEETRLQDAGLLWVSSVLVARSSVAHPTAFMPTTSSSVVSFAARDASIDLYCDHCGRDGHVNAFCYRKKKA